MVVMAFFCGGVLKCHVNSCSTLLFVEKMAGTHHVNKHTKDRSIQKTEISGSKAKTFTFTPVVCLDRWMFYFNATTFQILQCRNISRLC